MIVGLNGFGRVGQALVQQLASTEEIEIVAINEIGMTVADAASLLGSEYSVSPTGQLDSGRSTIEWISQNDHRAIGWSDYGVDVVVEASRLFHRDEMEEQSDNGKITILMTGDLRNSSPDLTLVLGVNEDKYRFNMHVLCAGSDRTQALVPILKSINDHFGLKSFRACLHRPPYVGRHGRIQNRPDNVAQLARALPMLSECGTVTRVEDPHSKYVTIWLDMSTNTIVDKRQACEGVQSIAKDFPAAVTCTDGVSSPVDDTHSALVDLSTLTVGNCQTESSDESSIWVKLCYDPIVSYAARIVEQLLFLSSQRDRT